MDILKTCKSCGFDKALKSFAPTVSKYKGKVTIYRQNICNTCKARGYRNRNPDKEKKRHARYKAENKDKTRAYNQGRSLRQSQKKLERKKAILDALGIHACQDCAFNDLRSISFHHRNPAEKVFNICHSLATSMTTEDIMEEARKCDVLCLNCHQIRHYRV